MLQKKRVDFFPKTQIDPLIMQWLKQRQNVLVHYSELCTAPHSRAERLERFCEVLLDYISNGHFSMFEKLTEFYQASQPEFQAVDPTLLNKILETTDTALDFNEKYTNPKDLESLLVDLSPLGEALANRMDWEDQLIKICLQFSA